MRTVAGGLFGTVLLAAQASSRAARELAQGVHDTYTVTV